MRLLVMSLHEYGQLRVFASFSIVGLALAFDDEYLCLILGCLYVEWRRERNIEEDT